MTDPGQPRDVGRYQHQVQLWVRAHREAAHAVVGTLLGGHVEEVAIWSGPPVGGRVRLTGLDDGTDRGSHGLVRRIISALAGPIAEPIAMGGPGAILNEACAMVASALSAGVRNPATVDGDPEIRAVVDLLLDHFGPDDEAGLAAAIDHLALNVEAYVREHWSGIQMVVGRLLRDGRLTEEQFHSLLTFALPAPPDDLLDSLPAPGSIS